MKLYTIYLLPSDKFYAVTDDRSVLQRFLTERNSELMHVRIKKCSKSEGLQFMDENKTDILIKIPLEQSDGDYEIIGTVQEEMILNIVVEKMAENCDILKLHFVENVPFNMEYKTILENLCTVSKNIDNHPIVQIDTVKLFYALFKNTFIDISDIENVTDTDHEELLNQYRANY